MKTFKNPKSHSGAHMSFIVPLKKNKKSASAAVVKRFCYLRSYLVLAASICFSTKLFGKAIYFFLVKSVLNFENHRLQGTSYFYTSDASKCVFIGILIIKNYFFECLIFLGKNHHFFIHVPIGPKPF